MSGFFIAVEGIDGTGKSSLVEGLAKLGFEVAPRRFEENYNKIKVVRAQSGPLSEIQALYLEGIKEISEQVILPGLAVRRRFVADRWLAGQIAANLLHQREVARQEFELAIPEGIAEPDLCLLLWADDRVRAVRMRARGELSPNDAVSLAPGAQALYRETITSWCHRTVVIDTTNLTQDEVLARVRRYLIAQGGLPCRF